MMDENFRKEYKLILTPAEIENFLSTFKCKDSELFEKRKVISVYMDTKNYNLFHNSEENDIDKYTLRYRRYSNNAKINFEVKENNMLGKHKTSVPTTFKSFEDINYLIYKNYKTSPALHVSYTRNYYSFKSARITIDRNLSFKNTKNRSLSTRIHNSRYTILEIKLLDNKNLDVEFLLLQNPQKFSKYKYGMSKIYNLPLQ
jgi:hypothetical protein